MTRPKLGARLAPFLILGLIAAYAGAGAVQAQGIVLYGVTGDGGKNSETLFRIDERTGSSEKASLLGNGNDGEEIAYNPDNGMLLHASGIEAERVLEWVDPETFETTPIPVSGVDYREIAALTYVGRGQFLAGDIDNNLLRITSAGVVSHVGVLDFEESATGFAYINGTLYVTEWLRGNAPLAIVNPNTGATTSSIKLRVDVPEYRFTALAAHPGTAELFAVMATEQNATNLQPGTRSLVKIDPHSGRVEIIGSLGDSFAGLAFVGEPVSRPVPPRANLSGIVAGVGPNRTDAPQAAPIAPATVAPAPAGGAVLRPPSTGEGGLR